MKAVAKVGKREQVSVSESPPQSVEQSEVISYSDADKKAILESWMGSRTSSENATVIHFAEVDKQLRLEPGSTKSLIKSVAARWDYVVQHEGEHTILFRQQSRSIRRSSTWAGY